MTALEALTLGRRKDVSPAAMHVLLAVLDDSPCTPSQVAKATFMSPAAITGAVDVLERGGWIHRHNHPRDRRSQYLMPTAQAFDVFTPALTE